MKTNKMGNSSTNKTVPGEMMFRTGENLQPDYQQWLKYDSWSFYDAIHLLLRLNPRYSRYDRANSRQYEPLDEREDLRPVFHEIERIVKTALKAGTLSDLTNPEKRGDFFEYTSATNILVSPRQFLIWASNKKISMPLELKRAVKEYRQNSGLSEQEVKMEDEDKIIEEKKPHGNTLSNEKKRNEILSAALAVLDKYKEKCSDKNGRTTGAKIANLILDGGLKQPKKKGGKPVKIVKGTKLTKPKPITCVTK